jgi:hypothetical protein
MRFRRIAGRVVGVVIALAAASASYFTAEAAWGWVVALASVLLALLVAPIVLARLRLPEEEAWRPTAGARIWTRFSVACGALILLLLASTARVSMCDAFRALPARHPELGPVARGFARLGDAIAPPAGSRAAPTSTPSATPSASVAAPAPAAPGALRFSSGDTSYREAACTPLADISDVSKGYSETAFRTALEAVATRRYPLGLPFIRAQSDAQLGAWFPLGRSTFAQAMAGFDTAVHEGSHVWNQVRFDGRTQTFRVRDDLDIPTRWFTTFPRSEILGEHPDKASDAYADTYLQGESGKQGFNSVLDEYNGYAHSLAARWCTHDTLAAGSRVSARDGILTFMFYVGEYLRIARARHPQDYAAILADPGHVKMIVTVWDRAEFWLRLASTDPALGVHDDRIATWAYDPGRLAEIGRVRDALRR